MKLAIITAHCGADCLEDAVRSWQGGDPTDALVSPYYDFIAGEPPVFVVDGTKGMLRAYQNALDPNIVLLAHYDILAFLHDDLLITEHPEKVDVAKNEPCGVCNHPCDRHESTAVCDPYRCMDCDCESFERNTWMRRVLKEFEDPTVGLVGFGGALIHGSPDLYRTPYKLQNLGRGLYRSNVEDAEIHGERFTGECDVSVLDGFALIVRREILEKAGGWPVGKLDYINYDLWLCCMAHRLGYRIRLVGCKALHLGGRTAVKLCKAASGEEYERAHRYIYENFADVLPYSVA
jgi:hypothetical protein